MKIIQLIKARRVFNSCANEKLSVALAYKLVKFIKASDAEDSFYNTEMQKIIEQYAEKDECGRVVTTQNGVKIIKEKLQECNSAIDNLSNYEVEAPNIMFTIGELSELKLSMSEMYILDEVIKEE